MSLNQVCLIGNVGQDPEIKSTQDGKKIANFSLATTEGWKDKSSGEKKTKTEWHKIVVFQDNLVKIIESYVKKGSKLYLQGSLQTRKWTDKKTNEDKYITEIILQGYACKIEMLGDAKNNDNDEEEEVKPIKSKTKPTTKQNEEEEENFDEVPF